MAFGLPGDSGWGSPDAYGASYPANYSGYASTYPNYNSYPQSAAQYYNPQAGLSRTRQSVRRRTTTLRRAARPISRSRAC